MSDTTRRALPNYEGVTTAVRKAEKLTRELQGNFSHVAVAGSIKEALTSVTVSLPSYFLSLMP